MKNILKKISGVILLLVCLMNQGTSQATAPVEYELVFNTSTCLYEAHAHVLSGDLNFPLTIPAPSNFTIVVPSSLPDNPIPVVEQVEPPTIPWTNGNNIYAPAVDPAHDYHMFSISGGGPGYTTFSAGDDILLFTFSLQHTSCDDGVRIYINGVDPNSSAEGMEGIDMTNSLKTSEPDMAIEQYTGNRNNGGITLPEPTPTPTFSCSSTEIQLMANPPNPYPSCLGALTYEWSGPDNFTSTDENPTITVTNKQAQSGDYTIVVTDANGCTAMASMTINSIVCDALPVELLSFDVEKRGMDALLKWHTANEVGNRHFEIHRSINGKEWHNIGLVKGKNQLTTAEYSFIDKKIGLSVDNAYYRLKQVDFDGNYTFSPIRLVNFSKNISLDVSVFPSLFTDRVSIVFNENIADLGSLSLEIYSQDGRKVYDDKILSDPGAEVSVDLSMLHPGMYYYKVVNSQSVTASGKLVKY